MTKKKILFWIIGIVILILLLFIVPFDYGYLGKGTLWQFINAQII